MKTLAARVVISALSIVAFAPTVVAQENFTAGQGLPVRVVRVQQYQDRMPQVTEDGRPVAPRTVTLVEFEVESCQSFREDDFEVRVRQERVHQLAQIHSAVDCDGQGSLRKFTIGTTQVIQGKAMIIANPVLIETVPDAY